MLCTHKTRNIHLAAQHQTLEQVLVRNGTKYFLLMLILNVLHLVFTVAPVEAIRFDQLASEIVTFEEPLTTILVSRFLLDLQEAGRRGLNLDSQGSMQTDTESGRSTIDFARIIGSLGSNLSAGGTRDCEEITQDVP
ncbi:hypothetical protein BD311DRAFT_767994 [Dichomitus squalens]|uniref:Uncharacterized protein n=1 Tax=Dichomitus squalens TaxID=114155 RepID=A0A4Q9M9L7_9APHY|nr:hypothetical protein BD311DRAFT_767994 [Dichomitus squalens]